MYKTEVIKGLRNLDKRAEKMLEIISENEEKGFELISTASSIKGVILIFKENLAAKLNKDIDKGVKEVTGRFNKIVDAITGK